MAKLTSLLDGTNKLIAALGVLAALLVATVTLIKSLAGSSPPGPEVSFLEAKIDPYVLLEQYGVGTQPARTIDYKFTHLPYWAPSNENVSDAVLLGTRAKASSAGFVNHRVTLVSSSPTYRVRRVPTLLVEPAAEEEAHERRAKEEREAKAHEERVAQQRLTEEEKRARELQVMEERIHREHLEEEAKAYKIQPTQPTQKSPSSVTKQPEQEESKRAGRETQPEPLGGTGLPQSRRKQTARSQLQARTAREEQQVKRSEEAKIKYEDQHPKSATPRHIATPPLHREGHAEVAIGTATPTHIIDAVLIEAGVNLASPCGESCPLKPLIDKAVADFPSSPAAAAQATAALFRNTRTVIIEHQRKPIGVTVNYTIDFTGYARKTLIVEWTLCSKNKGPLEREWWRNVIAKQVKPIDDNAKVAGSFWAPEPVKLGDYYLRLRVYDGEIEVANAETDEFH